MATRIQNRRGTAAQWTAANPILAAGEIGFETDTNKFKIGDGTNLWSALDYFIDANSTVNPSFGSSITFEGATANDFETTLSVTDPTADRTLTLPDATDTLVGRSTSDTLTNKSISLTNNTVTGTTSEFNSALSDSNFVTTGDTGTVTSTMISDGTIVDGDINAAAAIAQSKIANLTTDLGLKAPLADPTFTGTVTLPTGTVTAGMILDGTIVNADINASAAISQSKIDGLTTDLSSKLALAGGSMTGAIAMGTNKITGLGTPTDSTDAATKQYVDAVTEGLHIHPSVVAATTANVTLASDLENGDTLDGVTLATGNRILVKNQTTQSENGIYVVAASGAPSRATDFDSPAEIDGGDFVFVTGGTSNDNTGWVQVNTVGTVGTDAIAFTQFSGAGTYTAGNGLTLTGSVFTIDTAITQARVADVSDTEIGYLNGVTSAIQTQIDGKIAKTDISAKGAILVGTGSGTYVSQSVGTNGQVLTANSAQADGVEWTTIAVAAGSTLHTLFAIG